MLIVGSVIGFTPLPGSYVVMLVGIALTAFSAARRATTPREDAGTLTTAVASAR